MFFAISKRALKIQVALAHRHPSIRLCVYSDASDVVWSNIVMQVFYGDLPILYQNQRHASLEFLSGRFSGSKLKWSMLEKNADATKATVERMHCVLATSAELDLFTDYTNLDFFNALVVVPDIFHTSFKNIFR